MSDRKPSEVDSGRRDALKIIGGGAVTALIRGEPFASTGGAAMYSPALTAQVASLPRPVFTDADADFRYRSGRDPAHPQPGVLNWHKYDYVAPADLNTPAKMASISPAPILGYDARGPKISGTRVSWHYHWNNGELRECDPYIDPTVKVSGTGSLRLTTAWWRSPYTHVNGMTAGDPANSGGYAGINFSPSMNTFIGAGRKVYYQWRQRVSSTYVLTKHYGGDTWDGGIKHWSSKYAATILGGTVSIPMYAGINPAYAAGNIVRLWDASGKIVGNHSVTAIAYPNGGYSGRKAPTVFTLGKNLDPTVGNFTATLNIDPTATTAAYNGNVIGPKLMIGTVGDSYKGKVFGDNNETNQMHFSDWASHKLPIMSQGPSAEMVVWQGTLLQNMLPLCSYSGAYLTGDNCWRFKANEWATFKVLIDLTKATGVVRNKNGRWVWPNSEIKVWAAHEGEPVQLIVWWRPGIQGYSADGLLGAVQSGVGYGVPRDPAAELAYGKINIMNFMSYLDPYLQFPDWHMWYDEIIISTEDIPDPQDLPGRAVNVGLVVG